MRDIVILIVLVFFNIQQDFTLVLLVVCLKIKLYSFIVFVVASFGASHVSV